MSLRRFNKVFKPQDQEFNRLQDSIEQAVNPVIDSRIVDGVYIKEVDLSTADTFVEHKLGREPLGFIVVRKFAAGDVFESLTDSSGDNYDRKKFINIKASTSLSNVYLWIF
jgi:hypothetical protein|tara:strand:+ start:510 stop:842 length:333 start_codon:yes stop_codon:yes gene_type:complete